MNASEIVHIIDDDPAVRDSLLMLLEQHQRAGLAFESARSFLQKVTTESGGCAVVDVRMPGMTGLELQDEMARRHIEMPLVFLTGHGDIPMSVKAIKGGAVNFLTKPIRAAVFIKCIDEALELARSKRKLANLTQHANTRLENLTSREREVMQLVLRGMQSKEIGKELGISHRTVEIHRMHLMEKVGAKSVLELARMVQPLS